ncbi:hypothetical protein KGMB01110_24610 [Mediterraneibacter butyricigenes]|uniref:AAA+ ATPase domain-containing protein n=1 Tax=Mediterraneibacter butyricigenes TaxID=2316025 RepID=A0A391P379_9FIRM|nr:ATP-binding protein [Mediterraneibacter butyricigenes]GCA68025.1 hypothetical protein KGMB01110_24610 [Mediterraneibacter butyricigenes]
MDDIGSMLPSHTQEEVSPIKKGDYKGDDGLIRCGVCGERKQLKINILGYSRIVPCICQCRADELEEKRKRDEYEERMHTVNRLKDASMMASKFRDASFSKYKVRPENRNQVKLAWNYVKRFHEMKEKNQGLLLYGPVGTGKSYTAACIANALMEQSVTVVMTSFVKILQDIQSVGNEANYIQILNSASLLIIDDLGAERNTDYALEKVYNIIDSRSRTDKPMILTTNLELPEMLECTDIRYKRVYDRIFETCYPVEMKGKSFRQIEAAQRFENMQKFLG